MQCNPLTKLVKQNCQLHCTLPLQCKSHRSISKEKEGVEKIAKIDDQAKFSVANHQSNRSACLPASCLAWLDSQRDEIFVFLW